MGPGATIVPPVAVFLKNPEAFRLARADPRVHGRRSTAVPAVRNVYRLAT